MALRDRLHSATVRARAVARLLPHFLDLRRGGHASAALLLERNAEQWPDSTAILYENEVASWAELNAQANRWARFFLSLGVAHGDVVTLVMDNRPEYLFALMGLSKIRAVAACVNTNVTGSALAHAVRIGKPRLVLAGSEHEAAVREISAALGEGFARPRIVVHEEAPGAALGSTVNAEIDSGDRTNLGGLSPCTDEPMTYLYTSGTTGLPKAAIVTNQRFLATSYGFGKILHEAGPGDVVYVTLPLYHGTGQWGGFGACLTTGAALALRRKFSASAFWADAVRFRATRMTYIGELCRYLLHQPESPDEKRHLIRVAVGNGLRPDVWTTFQKRFGIPMIREFYGATEGNAPLANLEGRTGMIGRIGMGQALLACDPATGAVRRDANGRAHRLEKAGETGLFAGRISRVATFDGYVDTEATSAKVLHDVFKKGDAWFNTGDLLTLHEDSWVSFADRVGDTFRWKGENVSTNEVAELLNGAPGVLESNVYGVVVPGADGRAGMASLRVSAEFDVGVFARHVLERLPKFARPLFLRVQPDMRVTATLKHQKVEYRTEGYDPGKVREPIFVLQGQRYEAVTPELFHRIQTGEAVPG
jgi:acyl-CoA synthetase (AMP-forming)/AMP-acid ligase II